MNETSTQTPTFESHLACLKSEPVTQRELARLRQLRDEKNRLEQKCRQLRDTILGKLSASGQVEAGQYEVNTREQRTRDFSRKAIESAFGEQYTHGIEVHLPERVSTVLNVIETPYEP